MKKIKRKKFVTILVFVSVFICSLQSVHVQAAKVKLNKEKLNLLVNNSAVLKVVNKSGKVVWNSSDESVAIVKKGKVTARKKGTAVITAKVGKTPLSCKVKVSHKYSIGTAYKHLDRYLKKRYEKWLYVVFENEAMEWKGKYIFPVRYQGGSSANLLAGSVSVDPYTGKTVFKLQLSDEEQIWKIF